MATTTKSFAPNERFRILRLLPSENMSLSEARATRNLRRQLLTEDDKEFIGMKSKDGRVVVDNPDKIEELGDREITFGSTERRVLAHVLIQKEENDSVPNDDVFLDIAEIVEAEYKELS